MTGKNREAWLLPYVFLLAVFSLTPGTEALADDRDPFFGIGLHGNYFNTGDADDGTILGGLQVRLLLTENLAIEGAADYRKEEFDDGDISVEGYPFQVSGLWYLYGKGGISPHLIFGGSWYNSEVTVKGSGGLNQDENQEYNSNDFGYHGGFGLELHLTERSFFHADVRYMFLEVDYGDQSADHDGYVIQAGLTFYF